LPTACAFGPPADSADYTGAVAPAGADFMRWAWHMRFSRISKKVDGVLVPMTQTVKGKSKSDRWIVQQVLNYESVGLRLS
jgi:hypothetical protein